MTQTKFLLYLLPTDDAGPVVNGWGFLSHVLTIRAQPSHVTGKQLTVDGRLTACSTEPCRLYGERER